MDVRTQLYIGGTWVDPRATGTIDVIGASTEEVIGRVPDAGPSDMDAAVAAARSAFDAGPWPRTPVAERAAKLTELSAAISQRDAQLADTITAENGTPTMWSSMLQVLPATMALDYYAGLGASYQVEERRDGMLGGIVVQRQPVGVVAAIVPWNVPLYTAALKLAPALLAGCTVVLKPSPETALDAYQLAEAVDAIGLPGVVNVVVADRAAGEHLVSHPGVDKVAFTGSTAAGRKIAAACGSLLRPVTLELGGKSAAIVLDDADVAQVADTLLPFASMMNTGQACIAQTRVLAPRLRYEEMVEAMAEKVRTLPVGDPYDPTTVFGPLVTARQRERVESYIASGQSEGAKVAVGGGRPAHLSRGWYVEPTVLSDVGNDMRVAREEIFGPVVAVIPYDGGDEEAIRLANDSEYGLGGGVYTTDASRGLDVARKVQTGTMTLNGIALENAAPFGGVKASGLGRELGPEGLAAYTLLKSIMQVPVDA